MKFTYKEIEIETGVERVRDELVSHRIQLKLTKDIPQGTVGLWEFFAHLCSVTRSATGLSFDPTTLESAEPEVVKAAYESFLDLPKTVKNKWQKAMEAENPVEKESDPNVPSDG